MTEQKNITTDEEGKNETAIVIERTLNAPITRV
jgi:hypothetical protein